MRSPVPSPVRTLLSLLLFAGAAAPPAAGAEEAGHPFSVRDMVAMERLAAPQPSPDGAQVVFTRRVYDAEANRNHTNLWIVAIEGGEPRRPASARARGPSPPLGPDGRQIP